MSYVDSIIAKEQNRQNKNVELIASENFVSDDILRAVGSCLTNKYSEGYPDVRTTGNTGRYYGGCENVNTLEEYCCNMWRKVFNTDYHVNVQPHSGSNANMAAYMAVLNPGDTILAMNLDNGGHLTHGSSVNFSGKLYNCVFYDVDENGFIDYLDIKNKIIKYRPKLVLAGASAYSRVIDFQYIYSIIKCTAESIRCINNIEYDPYFMVDMSHIAGLIATGLHPTPFGFADIITTTTHKTLRGPRGGMIFCTEKLAKKIDSAVFPGTQGGPLQHIIAGKAVCAEEAITPEYHNYIFNVVENCRQMAEEFIKLGYKVVTGGTDNHLFLLDLSNLPVTGKDVQDELDKYNITVNKNMIPGDKRSPKKTSGVRIGTAAMTTKGYTANDFILVARNIDYIIKKMIARKENNITQ